MFVVFVLNGVVAGSWAPRLPALAERIDAGPGVLGRYHECDRCHKVMDRGPAPPIPLG